MELPKDKARRPDIRRRCQKEIERFHARESGHGAFWRSLAVLGGIGWPIVLFTVGGALVGHILDRAWDAGIRMTLMLLFLGVLLGSAAAWQIVRGTQQ